MTVDAVRDDEDLSAYEDRLRAGAEALAAAERRLLARAAALEGRPGVPDWCVPTLRRQAESCRVAAGDMGDAADVVGRHAARSGAGRAGVRAAAPPGAA
ncbi:hypothetical protein [Streptomyces lavendofoliae]|uniref:hypothetical protein n=1 Tax=Streptomyces lavendofoliae TaxID=67314 RepID=UPI00300F1047